MPENNKSTVMGRMKGAPLKVRVFKGHVKINQKVRFHTFETTNQEMTFDRARELMLEKVGRTIAKDPAHFLEVLHFSEETE